MKKKRILKVLGCLLLLGVVVVGGVWWYYRSQSESFGESVVLLRWEREYSLGIGIPFREE